MWLSWPKCRKLNSDLALPKVIEIGYDHGLVESTRLRIDGTWAAVKFTHPRKGKVYNNIYGTLPDALGVRDCVPLAVQITEPMEAVAVARIHWGLQRERCKPIDDFTALHTLVVAEGGLRIVAITHDELPKLQAALQGS